MPGYILALEWRNRGVKGIVSFLKELGLQWREHKPEVVWGASRFVDKTEADNFSLLDWALQRLLDNMKKCVKGECCAFQAEETLCLIVGDLGMLWELWVPKLNKSTMSLYKQLVE